MSDKFNLSWSHYLRLMRIEDEDECRFYQIESYKNNWSLRELQRQYDSALYTRLALSRNKKKILELSEKGLTIEKPKDATMEPYVPGFQNKSEAVVEYTLPENNGLILASKYQTIRKLQKKDIH